MGIKLSQLKGSKVVNLKQLKCAKSGLKSIHNIKKKKLKILPSTSSGDFYRGLLSSPEFMANLVSMRNLALTKQIESSFCVYEDQISGEIFTTDYILKGAKKHVKGIALMPEYKVHEYKAKELQRFMHEWPINIETIMILHSHSGESYEQSDPDKDILYKFNQFTKPNFVSGIFAINHPDPSEFEFIIQFSQMRKRMRPSLKLTVSKALEMMYGRRYVQILERDRDCNKAAVMFSDMAFDKRKFNYSFNYSGMQIWAQSIYQLNKFKIPCQKGFEIDANDSLKRFRAKLGKISGK